MDDTLGDRRKWIEAGLSVAYREADKLVVSVASAVLALSVAFIGQIEAPLESWSIKGSWFLLLASIVTVLASLVVEQQDKRSRIKYIDAGKRDGYGPLDTAVNVLNICGIAFFISGLGLLCWFLASNTL